MRVTTLFPGSGSIFTEIYPALEWFGFGLTGAEDEGVQAGSVNRCHCLYSAKGVHTVDPLLIFIQESHRRARISKIKSITNTLPHEPGFAGLLVRDE